MKKKTVRKLWSLVIGTAMVMSMITGCKNSTDEKKTSTTSSSDEKKASTSSESDAKKTIGFVGMTLNNEYHITLANGAKVEAKKKGVNIEVQAGDQHASADAQLTIIENMIANGVDGILLVPSSSDGLESALKKCKEANIPIINLDTKLTDESLKNADMEIPFYGTDNYAGAKMAGEYVAEKLEKGTKTAILKGIEGQTNAADRYNGFIEGAGDCIQIVAEQTANWEVDQGYTAAQNIISANPDVELFFCSNDNMGIGALRAIKEAGLKDQIQIIGFDAVSEALNLVESNEFLATVAQYPAEMGKLGVDNMLEIFDGKAAEAAIDTGTKVLLKNDIKEFREYLAEFEGK